MRNFTTKLMTLLLAATLTACAAPTSPTSLPPTTSALNTSTLSTATTVPPTATPMPNPLTVQVVVDESLAVSGVISTTGGTLTAQAADNTKFTLTFPEGALLNDEDITLTPVTSVEGLPFSGGLVGGVQMAPEGLRLFQPATLTIESPKTVAEAGFETVAFAYHQNGEGLYLNPSNATGNTLTLEIWHFSGAGAAQGTPAEIQTQQQQYVPSNAEDAFVQRMQEYIGRDRNAQLLDQNPDPEFGRRMGEFLREEYDSFIAPQLPIALGDCDAAPAILSRALAWSSRAQLQRDEREFQTEIQLIYETLRQAIVNCYNKEYDQCVIDNKIQHRTAMTGWLQQATRLGIEDRLDQSKIEKCPRKSYRAAGQQAEISYSGVVCDLGQPFTVNATSPLYAFTLTFAPSGPQAGSYTESGTWTDIGAMHGGGSYTVKAMDAVAAQLNLDGESCTDTPTEVGTVCRNLQMNIDLTPLDTNECGQP